MSELEIMGRLAADAKHITAGLKINEKNNALLKIADLIVERTDYIIEENKKDMETGKSAGMKESLLDRLKLTPDRIKGMAEGVRQVAALEDPVGEVISMWERPNGLKIGKKRVPIGVIGIIYESRPNVTLDAFSLCFKSGNTVILKGGSDAINSNKAIVRVIKEGLTACDISEYCIQLIESTDRAVTTEFMHLNGYVDVLIPRGGAGLIRSVVENATIPVIETGTGNCHIYVDETADLAMAVQITDNGKTQRPSVCNALETCLVHEAVAEQFLPMLQQKLEEHQVEIRGCERTRQILGDSVIPATEEDYATEFLDYIISIRVVSSVDEAIQHISKYSTGHSECIITESYRNAEKFQKEVDSACVYVNCSTRFTDGGEFGLGAEIGISTQKLHARGPMGLREMTTMKYLICGDGQIR